MVCWLSTERLVTSGPLFKKTEMEKEIYDMKLHETLSIEELDLFVFRVPGGWIYDFDRYAADRRKAVFVPFSKEFIGRDYDEE